MKRRTFALAAAAGTALMGAGCAALNTITADVSSFGDWPAGRAPGRYAFERLPSQEARAQEAEALERLARGAIERAGFVPVAAGQEPDVLVQIGARVERSVRLSPWDDPIWWGGGFGRWRHRAWVGPGWGWGVTWEPQRYEREVAVLLRDRASGKPLYESRAAIEGTGGGEGALLGALFQAAMMDFPKPGLSPRRVSVQLN